MWIVKVTLAGYQHPLSNLYTVMIMMILTVLLLRVLLLEKVRSIISAEAGKVKELLK